MLAAIFSLVPKCEKFFDMTIFALSFMPLFYLYIDEKKSQMVSLQQQHFFFAKNKELNFVISFESGCENLSVLELKLLINIFSINYVLNQYDWLP